MHCRSTSCSASTILFTTVSSVPPQQLHITNRADLHGNCLLKVSTFFDVIANHTSCIACGIRSLHTTNKWIDVTQFTTQFCRKSNLSVSITAYTGSAKTFCSLLHGHSWKAATDHLGISLVNTDPLHWVHTSTSSEAFHAARSSPYS